MDSLFVQHTLLLDGCSTAFQRVQTLQPTHNPTAASALTAGTSCTPAHPQHLPRAFCPSKPRAAHPPCKAGASTSTKQRKTMLKSVQKCSEFQLRKRELPMANISKGKITACGNYRSADKPVICEEFKPPEATNKIRHSLLLTSSLF